MAVYTERAFEEAVADHLVASGYLLGDPADFDPEIAIDTAQLFAWIEAGQPKQWARLTKRHGEAQVRQRFLQRLFARFQDNPRFKRLVKDHIRPRVYGRQRSARD